MVTWSKCCQPDFSSIKLLLFPFEINNLWWDTFRLCKCSVPIELAANNFSLHWWYSPESMITMVVVKWWFLNSVTHSTFIGWHSTLSKGLPSSSIYSFMYLKICLFLITTDSWIPIITYWGVQTVLDLASGALRGGFSVLLTWLIAFWSRSYFMSQLGSPASLILVLSLP